MERHFHEDYKQLNEHLVQLANLIEEAIDKSIHALKSLDSRLAVQIIDEDARIDDMEVTIYEEAIDILALYQPVAVDLRFITTALEISSNLERIADLAVNIAQRVLELADQPLLKPLIDIPRLAEIARTMVRGAIESFVNRDEQRAREVINMDETADQLRNAVQRELIYDYMVKDGTTAPRAVPLLLIARHLERICDQATNIAEDVIYMEQAIIVKHHPEKL